MKHIIAYTLLLSCLLLAACTAGHENAVRQNCLPPIYPDYAGVTVPVNIAPLNFLLRDSTVTETEVVLTCTDASNGETETHSQSSLTVKGSGNGVRFGMDEWKTFLQKAVGGKVNVQVYACGEDGVWKEYKPFVWNVVGDSIDPYLTYRLIEPDYEAWNKLQIKQRCIENWDEKTLADHNLQENRCMNCHAFGNQDARLSMMYVRGPGAVPYSTATDVCASSTSRPTRSSPPVCTTVSVLREGTSRFLPMSSFLPFMPMLPNDWRCTTPRAMSTWPTSTATSSFPRP